jgi:transcriptional regulator of acetoin/glycerol metabolism
MRLPASGTRLERRHVVDQAWRTYVQDGIEPAGVAEEIVRSWRRVREAYRIDPGMGRIVRQLSEDALQTRRERDEGLRLARPILEDFAARLGLGDHVLAYFDGDGWMLSIDGAPATVEGVAGIDFRPGACWSEDSAGTNGPGTALAEGRPVEVFASEHFVAAWQPWSCAAAPVRAPGLAAPVGLVDITGPWQVQRRQALVVARAIARAIEERLRAAASVRDEVVRFALRAAHETGDALVGVDGRGNVLAANDAAARRRVVEVGALAGPLKEALARTLTSPGAGRGAEVRLDLPDVPKVVVSPVTHEGAVIGAILRAPLVRAEGARAPRSARPRSARYDFGRILGRSEALQRALALGRVAARNTLPVVLFGESGTGKELFAHAIHAEGDRRDERFVAVNCGSIPATLVEAELFGYEAGTFTGGRREGNSGRFEDAEGGTLFLDEVSELPPQAQAALLRVLQEKEVVRLGGSAPRPVDVRVIAASNKPLAEEVRARRFRRDLYYRLNVLSITIPPLRERADDLALLAEVFLAEAETEVGRRGLSLAPGSLQALRAHDWPGNVRELKNVILRAAATAPRAEISAADLMLQAEAMEPAPAAGPAEAAPRPATRAGTLRGAVLESEREVLLAALEASDWNFARVASRLEISRMTLYRRLAKCGIARARPAR